MKGFRATAVAGALAVMALALGTWSQAAAASGPAEPVASSTGVLVDEVSHDGRFVLAQDSDIVRDRLTGGASPPACQVPACTSLGFVRDNPSLQLLVERSPRPGGRTEDDYRRGSVAGLYLVNTATGVRTRVDTDSGGTPLKPSWSDDRPCGNEWCDNFYDIPDVFASDESVSRTGRMVAFCANYEQSRVPVLYVKDTTTGALTRTSLRCPIIDTGEGLYTRAPQISANGRIVHVNGDVDRTGSSDTWTADRLHFTASRTTRTVKGWGSMTRNGGTIFLRIGVRATPTQPARIPVGAYSVGSRTIRRLSGGDTLYGTPVADFSAFDQASYRGRFVVGLQRRYDAQGTSTSFRLFVTDRASGATTDLGSLLRGLGYEPSDSDARPLVSGDGRVVMATVRTSTTTPEETAGVTVAITGWEPTARAVVTAGPGRIVIDVDPDRGSGSWILRVQAKRADGSWRTLKARYRTQGKHETRTIPLPPGTYRVVVGPKYGYRGSTSGEVVVGE